MKLIGQYFRVKALICLFFLSFFPCQQRLAWAEGFQTPDAEKRRVAIGELKYSPDVQIRAFSESPLFAPKTPPEAMDWLANHEERGQTFDQFLRTRRNLFQPPRQVLYIQPLGAFTEEQKAVLSDVAEYGFARYGEPGDDEFLHRCLHVFAHETGHMFAIMHCIHFECVMNGSNHLAESDATPLQLCPVCLRKLHAANAFDIRKRYESLQKFFEREELETDADWMKRRLAGLP